MTKCANSECTKPGVHLCGGCKGVRFCSTACQKVHWKQGGHKSKSARPPPQMPQAGRGDADANGAVAKSLSARSISELKKLIVELGETSEGCIEKADLVRRAVGATQRAAGVSTTQWSGHCRLVPLARAIVPPSPIAHYRVARARLHTRISFTRALISLPPLVLLVPQLPQPCLLCTFER